MSSPTVIKKETKNRIRVDYEGKLSFKEKFTKKLKASRTWIRMAVNFCRFILMLGVSYVILYPFIAYIAGSFMPIEDIGNPLVALIPKHPTLNLYKTIALENDYLSAFVDTLWISLTSALLQTFIACLVGYGLSKFKFKGNKLVMVLVVFTMIIPPIAIESAMMQHFVGFDLFHVFAWNYKGPIEAITGSAIQIAGTPIPIFLLAVTGLAFKNGLYIYLMRQFFKGVPDELEESAYVDGANTFRTFFQIIIPLSIPMMITIFLFSFSWQWTDTFYFETAYQYGGVLPEGATLNMSYFVRVPKSLVEQYGTVGSEHYAWGAYEPVITNTAAMMAIAPLIIMYLFCQRYLVQGIERSGLVG